MDDYNYGNGNDNGNVTGVSIRTSSGHNQWPTPSTDIIDYDSSIITDTPILQQQQTQFLLPHQQQQQQQQRQRNNNFPQKSGATVAVNSNAGYTGKSGIISAAVDNSTNDGSTSNTKWKIRAMYIFLTCLLAIVIINLTLTLWFIRVTHFTSVTKNNNY